MRLPKNRKGGHKRSGIGFVGPTCRQRIRFGGGKYGRRIQNGSHSLRAGTHTRCFALPVTKREMGRLNSPSEDNDIEKRANDIFDHKGTSLHKRKTAKGKVPAFEMVDRINDQWVDSDTMVLYISMSEVARRDDLAKWMMATAPIFFLRCGSTVLASGRSSKRIGCRRKKSKSTNELFRLRWRTRFCIEARRGITGSKRVWTGQRCGLSR